MDELKKVEELAKQLPEIDSDTIEDCVYGVAADYDWYYDYNDMDCSFGQAIGDYQVLRTLCLRVYDRVRWSDKDAKEYEGAYNDYEDFLKEHPEEKDREDYESFLKAENDGDFHQYWLNVKTGVVVEREKKDGERFAVDGEWQAKIIDIKDAEDIIRYYYDYSLHKAIVANWGDAIDDDEEEIEHHVMLWHDILTNPYVATIFRYGGAKLYNLVQGEDGKEYAAAVKIANRHKYVPADTSLWIDYLKMLVYLKKDVHNPFYVCPQDIRLAHDNVLKTYNRKKEQERIRMQRERDIARLMEEKERITNYANRIATYLSLNWSTPNYHIFVCPTVQDMIEEGAAMSHCVGSMGYDKKADSLILFCRDHNGKRISTIEYSISNGKVLQNRGKCNKEPEYMNEVNALLEASADMIRGAKIKKMNVKPAVVKAAA